MRSQGQARFTGHIVRDAINKERWFQYCAAVLPGVAHCHFQSGHKGKHSWESAASPEALIPNDVAVPKWNPISVIFVVSLCELALVAGFYLAWRAWR